VIRNTDHYRDRAQQIRDHEAALTALLGAADGTRLCALLKATAPKIYKDQLAGARRILRQHANLPDGFLDRLLQRPRLTATALRDYLDAYLRSPQRLQGPPPGALPTAAANTALRRYADLTAQELRHERR